MAETLGVLNSIKQGVNETLYTVCVEARLKDGFDDNREEVCYVSLHDMSVLIEKLARSRKVSGTCSLRQHRG
jgi:hypothetical protein